MVIRHTYIHCHRCRTVHRCCWDCQVYEEELYMCMSKCTFVCVSACVCLMCACVCVCMHCKNLGGQSPPFCPCYHTNCPFGVLWETKWWALPTFVFTVLLLIQTSKQKSSRVEESAYLHTSSIWVHILICTMLLTIYDDASNWLTCLQHILWQIICRDDNSPLLWKTQK